MNFSEKKILIVEDDELTQYFYQQLFKKTDFKIILLEDGDEIIESVKTENFSLIILDINLKNTYLKSEKTDGIKLAQYIKNLNGFENIPILLITAYQKGFGINDYLKNSGADDYITKPISDYNIILDKANQLTANYGKG